jgi:RNA polymerase sigma factor (sigma-70 family)
MGEQMERSPALAAPGSKNCSGLIASSTITTRGREAGKVQVLSDKEANELCERYLPLAHKTAGLYTGRGVAPDEVRSASVAGLFEASRRYDPLRGPFGPYAKLWCKGEITALFKDANRHRADSLSKPAFEEESDGESFFDRFVADEATPAFTPDLSGLTEKEQRVVLGRAEGETLTEAGRALNLSAERVRQIETRAHNKLRKTKDGYPLGVAPRDHEARRFRDEYLACNGKFSALKHRRGYRKPSRELLPFRAVTYPCRSFSKAEIKAYERGEL